MFEILLGALMWRARGSGFWGYTKTDTAARLGCAITMALVAADLADSLLVFPIMAIALFAYQTPAVSPFASLAADGDASGGQLTQRNDPPVDWILDKLNLPTGTVMQRRIWGTVGIGIRLAFIAPALVVLAFMADEPWCGVYALASPLLGLAYFLAGFVPVKDQRAPAEYMAGAGIGGLLLLCSGA